MDENQLQAMPDEAYKLSPESLEMVQAYLTTMDIDSTAEQLLVDRQDVVEFLNKKEVQRFINTVFLDQGYANQFKLQGLLDKVIASKLEEAEESEIFTSKDLVDLITLQHKMRMDYLDRQYKREVEEQKIQNQTNVQVNSYGGDNFSRLMDQLLNPKGG